MTEQPDAWSRSCRARKCLFVSAITNPIGIGMNDALLDRDWDWDREGGRGRDADEVGGEAVGRVRTSGKQDTQRISRECRALWQLM